MYTQQEEYTHVNLKGSNNHSNEKTVGKEKGNNNNMFHVPTHYHYLKFPIETKTEQKI